jgi:hypothetical protein
MKDSNKPIDYNQDVTNSADSFVEFYLDKGGLSEIPKSMLKDSIKKYIVTLDTRASDKCVKYLNHLTGKNYLLGSQIDKEDVPLWKKIITKEKKIVIDIVAESMSIPLLKENPLNHSNYDMLDLTQEFPDDMQGEDF